ncbi:MAG: carbohydrate binding domain-containing protein, partial [Armatimonadetes bacterium]|nr:carbohydrate binding domain-containing protein [Armatimonadota bacterium]
MNCRDSILIGVLIALLSIPAGARTRKNLVYNSGFELENNGLPEGWQWSEGKAKARLKVDHSVSHSGHSSAKLTNPSPEAPQVYGLLRQTIQLQAGQTYTLSCYVHSSPASSRVSLVGAWFGGGHQWLLRKVLPANPDGWQRIALTFTAKPEDTRFDLIIVTDSVTDGLWIDDVQLESGVAATDYESNKPLQPGQVVLSLQPVGDRENLLPNSSFEVVDDNRPKHYVWDPRNTDATMVIDASVARSGTHSLRLTNGTQFGPHIYGIVSLQEGARVKPNTTYTFSCYVKGGHTGIAWFGGAAGWLIRAAFPRETGGKWARVVRTFTTGEEEQIPVLIVTENPTAPVWVDDIQLVEGNTPAPYFLEEGVKHPVFELAFSPPTEAPEAMPRPAWNPSRYPPDQFTFTGGDLWAEGILYLPDAVKKATVEVSLQDKNGRVLAEVRRTEDLPRGAQAVEFGWNPGTAIGGNLRLGARLLTPEVAANTEVNTRLITRAEVEEILERDEALRAKLRKHLAGLKKVGKDSSYPQVTLTLLDNFLNYARDDLKRGEVARAYDAARQMESMGKRCLEAKWLPPVPRFVVPRKGRPFRIAGSSFLGTVRWPEGRLQANREIQFVGHGHFDQVRSDVEKFPGYGVNILQVEFGPNSVLTSENEVNLQAVDDFLKLCDRAQKAGVAVNLLLSPHYFPGWAMDKWPFLGDCTGGFLRYCIHAPESRSVLEKFLRVVIPRIKDHPALHSLCLSNEPLSIDSAKCRYMARFWHDWLVKEHGNVGRLNEIWGKKYGSIEEIAVPEARMEATPITYDFMRCNCEAHAGFHRWMADLIHEMAPNLPVHAKIMMSAHFARHQYGPWCVDPELFADLSQINGNDCCKWYSREGDWAANFIGENMGYDFQRSVGDLPVFNSENHIITDRDQDYVAPDYIRNVYWQGAVHGQSATTTWVWERAFDPRSDFTGS